MASSLPKRAAGVEGAEGGAAPAVPKQGSSGGYPPNSVAALAAVAPTVTSIAGTVDGNTSEPMISMPARQRAHTYGGERWIPPASPVVKPANPPRSPPRFFLPPVHSKRGEGHDDHDAMTIGGGRGGRQRAKTEGAIPGANVAGALPTGQSFPTTTELLHPAPSSGQLMEVIKAKAGSPKYSSPSTTDAGSDPDEKAEAAQSDELLGEGEDYDDDPELSDEEEEGLEFSLMIQEDTETNPIDEQGLGDGPFFSIEDGSIRKLSDELLGELNRISADPNNEAGGPLPDFGASPVLMSCLHQINRAQKVRTGSSSSIDTKSPKSPTPLRL